jgi:DNA invertase Pin-like site-specific DNA recombinase
MTFAYIRVSTKEQNTDRQRAAIDEYAEKNNITINRILEEKASGKDFNREVYKSLKITLRSGDILVIKELDRLGRNMEQIKEEWNEFQKMGVDIIVIDNEMLNTANKTDLEKTLISNIIFELLSYMAQKEREKIRTRQAEGIAIAKSKGKYTGRKPLKRDNFEAVYESWKAGEIKAVEAMEILEISKATFYRKVKKHEQGAI